MHEKNIKKVQIETVKIITETEKTIECLIENEKKIKDEDRNKEKTLSYKNLIEHLKILKNEKQKLDNLEYVVAVVGTMKAGKSMTINAIVGQEILPSREFPMTTLPTLITHKPKQEKPILNLKNIEPFEKLVKEIKEKVETSRTSEQRDLNSLIDEIKNNKISFKISYEGQMQIEGFLKRLNDLMRIAKDFGIEPPYKDFTDVDDLPRIEVEFYHLSKEENSSNAKLTLLDTPGPDEFKHSTLLKEIFKNQLQRASAVMLLVDYTKMNSQSDVEIKEQVKEVADMIGKQHLFVLLNKFDQRKRSDGEAEKKEEAKRLIAEDVLKDQIDKNNIYPISAKSAFYANFGLRELEKNGKIDTSLNWIDDFGNEVLGRRWEKYIQDEEEVREACSDAWDDSFFEEPLENIISTIHSDALFLSLKSPLGKLENLLREYSNAFKTRKNAYQKELLELKDIIESLKEDINKVAKISKNIKNNIKDKAESIKSKIKEESRDIIEKIGEKVKEKLNASIESKKEEEENRKNEGHKVDNSSVLHKELWSGGLLDFMNKDKNSKNSKNSKLEKLLREGKITYKKKDKAKGVIDEINNLFIQVLNKSSKVMEQNINENISELSKEIDDDIKSNLGSLLSKIGQKLSEEGDNLVIDLPTLNVSFDFDSQGALSASIKKDTETYRAKGDGWVDRSLNWLNSSWGTVEKTRNIFVIEKKEIIENIEKSLMDIQTLEMDKLSERFDCTIKKPIDAKLQILTHEIEGYRAEQIEILKKKENSDKEFLEEELQFTKRYQKKITKLDSRVKISINVLGANNE
ncbi:DNA double-strand break repair Rad50 ATPase [hydrothermal vent metagenome]|uniref:DNA double-strand break repair Rad50 ATPase n=1 Tax=hydrothermal vent metagenome TaxID=652676 RepID=A0A1W1BQ93_9ZZZZ